MKASDLANLLLRSPDSDVRVASPLSDVPRLLTPADIALNNEANAWIISTPGVVVARAQLEVLRQAVNKLCDLIEQDDSKAACL